jgi:hypothetical protein
MHLSLAGLRCSVATLICCVIEAMSSAQLAVSDSTVVDWTLHSSLMVLPVTGQQSTGKVPEVQERARPRGRPPCSGVLQRDGPVLDGVQCQQGLAAPLEAARPGGPARRRAPLAPHHALLQMRGDMRVLHWLMSKVSGRFSA